MTTLSSEYIQNILRSMRPILTKTRIMIFDVETSGLLPKVYGRFPPLDMCPHILQLSFIVYDVSSASVVSIFDTYINVDASVEISSFITELTGITREKCNEGILMTKALSIFYREYSKCDCIVAHNMEFDKTMIAIEMNRHAAKMNEIGVNYFSMFNDIYNRLNNIELYCTMKMGKDICNLVIDGHEKLGANGISYITRPYKKYPKLSELYHSLFGTDPPNGLHNSLIDTYVCLKCFFKMKEADRSIIQKMHNVI